MSKEAKHTLIPKLRFPEFREAEAWPYLHGDEIFNQISDKNHNSDLPILAITQEQGAIPRNEIDYNVSVTEKSVESYKIVNISDFIISLRSFQGGIEYSNYTGICSPAYIILRKKLDIDELFFKYYFKSDVLIKDLNKNLEGIRDGKMISFKQFSDVLLPIPTKKEQQKIAATLTSLDELISAQGEKIKALQAHKKWLMQQLFPAEGETMPRLRFGEFEGEWEETTLGQVIEYENGKAHEQDIAEVGEFIVVNSKFVSTEGLVKKYTNSPFCLAKKGDILMVLSDVPNGKAIAKCFYVDVDNLYTVNQRIGRITPQDVDNIILFYAVNRNPYFLSFDDGVKQTNLRNEDVLNCPLLLPINPKEQQKIASTLTSLDDLLSAQNQKLEALKTLKKGLMQALFP